MTPPIEGLDPEERALLQLTPLAKEIMGDLRERLPPGTHFGVMILIPGEPEGRIVAITTDREIVAHAVGQWVLSALPGNR